MVHSRSEVPVYEFHYTEVDTGETPGVLLSELTVEVNRQVFRKVFVGLVSY